MKMFLGYCGWEKGAFTFNETQVAELCDSTFISGDGMGGAGGSSVVDGILDLKVGESMSEYEPSQGHCSVIRIADNESINHVYYC